MERAVKDFEEWNTRVDFSVLDPKIQLQKQGIQAASVDIVLTATAATDFSNVDEMQKFLQNIRSSLKEGGKLILMDSAPKSVHR